MSGEIQPADFVDRLETVEEELAERRGVRVRAWRWLTLRLPLIGGALYLGQQFEQMYAFLGLIFVGGVLDLWRARRAEERLMEERDELLLELDDGTTGHPTGDP